MESNLERHSFDSKRKQEARDALAAAREQVGSLDSSANRASQDIVETKFQVEMSVVSPQHLPFAPAPTDVLIAKFIDCFFLETQAELEAEIARLTQTLEDQDRHFRSTESQLSAEKAKLVEQVENSMAEKTRLEKEIMELMKIMKQIGHEKNGAREEVACLQSEKERALQEMHALVRQKDSLMEEKRILQDDLNRMKSEIEKLREENDKVRHGKQVAEEYHRTSSQTLTETQRRVEELEVMYKTLSIHLNDAQAQIEELTAKLVEQGSLEEEIRRLCKERDDVVESDRRRGEAVSRGVQLLRECEETAKALRLEKDELLDEMANCKERIASLMQQIENKSLEVVVMHGRLSGAKAAHDAEIQELRAQVASLETDLKEQEEAHRGQERRTAEERHEERQKWEKEKKSIDDERIEDGQRWEMEKNSVNDERIQERQKWEREKNSIDDERIDERQKWERETKMLMEETSEKSLLWENEKRSFWEDRSVEKQRWEKERKSLNEELAVLAKDLERGKEHHSIS